MTQFGGNGLLDAASRIAEESATPALSPTPSTTTTKKEANPFDLSLFSDPARLEQEKLIEAQNAVREITGEQVQLRQMTPGLENLVNLRRAFHSTKRKMLDTDQFDEDDALYVRHLNRKLDDAYSQAIAGRLTTESAQRMAAEIGELLDTQDARAKEKAGESAEEGDSILGFLTDQARGAMNGLANFTLSAGELAMDAYNSLPGEHGYATGSTFDQFVRDPFARDPFGRQTTVPGSLVSGFTQFAVPFGAAVKARAGLGIATGSGARAFGIRAAEGAAADFLAFSPTQGRLSDMLAESDIPGLDNVVTQYLASDGDDSWLEGRMKNVLEGGGLGVIAETFIRTLRGVREGRKVKRAGGDEAAATDAMVKAMGDDLPAIIADMEQKLPTEHEIVALAKQLHKEAGSPPGLEHSFRLAAEFQLNNQHLVRPRGRPASPQTLNDRAVERFVSEMEKVQHQAPDGSIITIDSIVRGLDFNFSKMESTEALATMNAMSRAIPDEMATLKGGVQSLAEISEAAKAFGLRPQELLRDLGELGAQGEKMARTMVAGKLLTQSLMLSIARDIKRIRMRGGGSDEVLSLLGERIRLAGAIEMNVKASITGMARGTSAGRIKTGPAMNIRKLLAMSDDQLEEMEALLIGHAERGDLGAIRDVLNPPGFLHKFLAAHNEVWFNSMLSGVKTHLVNLLASPIKMAIIPGEQIAGELINPMFWIKGDRTVMNEAARMYGTWISGINESWRMARAAFWAEKPILTAADKWDIPRSVSANYWGVDPKTTGGWLLDTAGKMVRLPGTRIMATTDEFNKQMAYRAHVRSQAIGEGMSQRLGGQALDDYVQARLDASFGPSGRGIDDRALRFAEDVTWTLPLDGPVLGKLHKFVGSHPIWSLGIQFMRVATNLISDFVQRSPGGPILSRRLREDLRSADPSIRAQARGRIVSGVALWSAASWAANSGLVTGRAPRDPDLRREMLDSGWRPYSVKIGDRYVQMDRLDPWFMPFALMADFVHVEQEIDDGRKQTMIGGLLASTAEYFRDKTFFRSMAEMTGAFGDPDSRFEGWLRSRASSYVPNILNSFNNDPAAREIRSITDAMMSRIPGFSDNLPPRRNLFGEKMRPIGGVGIERINPMMTSKITSEKHLLELMEIGANLSLPAEVDGQIDLREYHDDKGLAAYDRLMELHGEIKLGGKTLKERVLDAIDSPQYQKLPKFSHNTLESGRVVIIRDIVHRYRKAAMNQVRKEYPDLSAALQQQAENRKRARVTDPSQLPAIPEPTP